MAYVAHGDDKGKLAVIIDVIDQNRVSFIFIVKKECAYNYYVFIFLHNLSKGGAAELGDFVIGSRDKSGSLFIDL